MLCLAAGINEEDGVDVRAEGEDGCVLETDRQDGK